MCDQVMHASQVCRCSAARQVAIGRGDFVERDALAQMTPETIVCYFAGCGTCQNGEICKATSLCIAV
jgi:hypothetical protein